MKKYAILLLASGVIFISPGCKQGTTEDSSQINDQFEILVNPTFELFSLISRLAEINQYTENLLPAYIAEVEEYFGRLADHPTIEFARECNENHSINGDAPMSLAAYTGPPPALEPKIDLSALPADFDSRWDSALISEYLEHARTFAKESRFMEFMDSREEFQQRAVENMEKMMLKKDIFGWYADYFGYLPEGFKLYVALLNGSCCYGYPLTYPDGRKESVAIIGARYPDREGVPTYGKDWYLPIIIHEYMHGYINPLIRGNPALFEDVGNAVLATHEDAMVEHGYDLWYVVLQEYIVRACTIRYLEMREGHKRAERNRLRDIRVGFQEIDGLVALMETYESNRDRYPGIEDFLPEISEYFQQLNP